jgi:hypothetical protein
MHCTYRATRFSRFTSSWKVHIFTFFSENFPYYTRVFTKFYTPYFIQNCPAKASHYRRSTKRSFMPLSKVESAENVTRSFTEVAAACKSVDKIWTRLANFVITSHAVLLLKPLMPTATLVMRGQSTPLHEFVMWRHVTDSCVPHSLSACSRIS